MTNCKQCKQPIYEWEIIFEWLCKDCILQQVYERIKTMDSNYINWLKNYCKKLLTNIK